MPDLSTPCVLWTGTIDRSTGYGRVGDGRYAHRLTYERVNGPIPEGLTIDHLCRTRACVNVDHLEAVTFVENVLRGEGPTAKNRRKTHCKYGHEFTPENTYVEKLGRACKACRARISYNRFTKHRNPPPPAVLTPEPVKGAE